MNKKILSNCMWKPIFSAVMTAVFTHVFASGKWESIVLALLFGGLCGLTLCQDVKKALPPDETQKEQ